jgi:hypothetical protein
MKLIEEAKKFKVKAEVIEEALKTVDKCNYAKSVEEQITKSLAEKNWAVAKDLYLKAISQELKIEGKILTDCKNQLMKQKMLDK